MPRLLLVNGSLRDGSTSGAVLRTAAAVAPPDVDAVLATGLRELPHFDPDLDREGLEVPGPVATWRAQVAAADALLVCTPEYAGTMPGVLKTALEWTVGDGGTYAKPVAWVNAAGPAAPTGAQGTHEALAAVLGYTGAVVVAEACVRLPLTRDRVGAGGELADPGDRRVLAAAVAALAAAVPVG